MGSEQSGSSSNFYKVLLLKCCFSNFFLTFLFKKYLKQKLN